MPIYVYPSANNPKLVKKLWIFFQGSWRSITSASVYSGGLWRKLYTSEFDPISVDGGTDVDLREKWRARYPNDTPAGRITITLTSNCIASSTGAYALKTGRWPSDVELIVNINSGVVVAGRGGNGGAGTASTLSGTSATYAGGGGGAIAVSGTSGTGGAGGGGDGAIGTAFSGTANTGGGGGGGGGTASAAATGGAGGSGIVIIKVRQ